MKKTAFTLAEVLITLGIIGIIAALTLPVLTNRIQGQTYKTGLEKQYSVLSNALQRYNNEQGFVSKLSNYSVGTEFSTGFKKYFNILKDCNLTSCIGMSSDEDDGSVYYVIKNYKTYNKSGYAKTRYFDDGQFILTDGTILLIEANTSSGSESSSAGAILITVDVNGYKKGPNIWGHDLFTFEILESSGKLLPMGAEGTHFTDMNKYCSAKSSDAINGISCTYKAMTDKDYFKNLP